MSDFDLDNFLPYQLSVLASRVSREFAKTYGARFGLSIPEWRVMAHLSQSEAISVRDLHLRADLEKSKASRAVSRLEEAGMVDKRVSSTDRRLLEVSMTPMGRDAMAELIPMALNFEKGVIEALSAKDRAALSRILSVLLTP
ncbi:MAG: MarR family winged helix-turn-helix transcriptional regulator [Pseudomonadota bacterium]